MNKPPSLSDITERADRDLAKTLQGRPPMPGERLRAIYESMRILDADYHEALARDAEAERSLLAG